MEVEAGMGRCSHRGGLEPPEPGTYTRGWESFSPRAALLASRFQTSSFRNHEREDVSVVLSH